MHFIDIIYHIISPQRFSLEDIIYTARNIISGKVLVEARELETIQINKLAEIIGSNKDLTIEFRQYMKNSKYAGNIRSALYTHRHAIYKIYMYKSNILDQIHSLVEELYVQTKIADEIAEKVDQDKLNP